MVHAKSIKHVKRGSREKDNKKRRLPEEKSEEYPYYKLAHLELAPQLVFCSKTQVASFITENKRAIKINL